MRRTRNVKRTDGPAPKLVSGREGNSRADVALIDQDCKNGLATCEPVRAPRNATATCGRCVQKMVGGEALPKPPLTKEERLAKLVEDRKAKEAE